MPNRLTAGVKTALRTMSRALGYDLVPTSAGLARLQAELLADSRALIDVGANVGQYAERARNLGFLGDIYSFEPSTDALSILRRKAAPDPRWHVRSCGLGAAQNMQDLHVSANSVSSSLLRVTQTHIDAAPQSIISAVEPIMVSTMDDELSDLDRWLFIKLDVQGTELDVLAGAEQTLSKAFAVQAEVSFDQLYEGQSEWIELCRYVQDNGFIVRYIEPGYENASTGCMLQADILFVRAGKYLTTADSPTMPQGGS